MSKTTKLTKVISQTERQSDESDNQEEDEKEDNYQEESICENTSHVLQNKEKYIGNNIDEEDEDSWQDQELMPRALPVNSDSDLDSNQTDYEGLQYLLNVRREANKTSNVMIAKNVQVSETQTDAKYIPESIFKGEFTHTPVLTQWEEDQLTQFKSFKRHLEYVDEQVKKGVDINEVISNYYSQLEDDKYVKSKKCFMDNFMNSDFSKVVIPTTQTLHKVSYVRLEKMIDYIHQVVVEKISEINKIIERQQQSLLPQNQIKSIEQELQDISVGFEENLNALFMNYYQFLWIYALLGKLDVPVLAEISGALNDIMKLCVLQKKHYPKQREDSQMVEAMCSMLILLIRQYYGQKYTQI